MIVKEVFLERRKQSSIPAELDTCGEDAGRGKGEKESSKPQHRAGLADRGGSEMARNAENAGKCLK